jgi:hypothetical protein
MSANSHMRAAIDRREAELDGAPPRNPPPAEIEGVVVRTVGKPVPTADGGSWQTLVVDADDFDGRVWEFNVISGELIQTQK